MTGPRYMMGRAYAGEEFENIVKSGEFRRHFNYDRALCFLIGASAGVTTANYLGWVGF